MTQAIELFYNLIEALLITGFLTGYFGVKPKFSKGIDITLSFILIWGFSIVMTLTHLSWAITLIFFVSLLMLILRTFYRGVLLNQLLMSVITAMTLALIDVCILTLMSKILGIDYSEMVHQNNLSRFWAVLISKSIYLIFISIVVSLKRKYAFMLHRVELFMISSTLIISGILISIVRNIIYDTQKHYNAFLIILLCLILLNIIQYYMMIYISKKNIKEKNMYLMQKQIEMQEDSIRNLEVKYDETAKLRHDIKNHVSCALKLARQGDTEELTKYLNELSEDKINNIISYIKTKRKILGAVLNSKLAIAERKGIDMQCVILNEMDNIKEIDLGVLLANLLDNAIEACEKNKGPSEIMLKMWNKAGYYCIEIINTVERNILAENPNLYTSKANKELHGVGLRSVEDIVEKYNGIMNFLQRSCKFHVYILLER